MRLPPALVPFFGLFLGLFLGACEDDPDGNESAGSLKVVLSDLDGAAQALFAPSPDALFVAGGRAGRGMILRYDGKEWTRMDGGGEQELHGLWGAADDAIWAVGDGGTILRWDGAEWTAEASSTEADLYAVWGRPGSEIWAVGGSPAPGPSSVIVRRTAAGWVPDEASGTWNSTLRGVGGDSERAWIVGGGDAEGALLLEREEGGAWARVDARGDADLFAVHAREGEAWAVGRDALGAGVALRRREGAWAPTQGSLPEPLMGVFVDDEAVFLAGSRGYLARVARSDDAALEERPADEATRAVLGERCLAAVIVDEAWGLWAAGGGCPGDNADLGILAHEGEAASGGPVRNLEHDGGAAPDAGGGDDRDGGIDQPPDGAGIGPGDECPSGTGCAAGLQCWFLAEAVRFVCTHPCGDADDCGNFASPCCTEPGQQTSTTVCIPEKTGACE
ncbi:MAG: hypothetical protein AABZ30_12385 [Myxococcota bacterium]